ncbi:MAG: O-antigen ligase family protein [Porphyromonadaceae bacterium]|nr:O-antigen ligase family protein [Porphyromonadaceae bacterium]
MALLLPLGTGLDIAGGENIYITYPFRAFQMIVAALALFSVRGNPLPHLSWKTILLGVFWILYFARAFWDLAIAPPYNSELAWRFYRGSQFYYAAYVFVDFFPLLAILKGWNEIKFDKVLKWGLFFGFWGLVFSTVTLTGKAEESWTGELGRASASRVLHTQALGNFGCYLLIMGLYAFFVEPKSFFWKVLGVVVSLVAFYIMLKSGSRGPVLGFIIVVAVWLAIKRKNFIGIIVLGVLLICALILFQDQILSLIGKVSSTTEVRLRMTLESGDMSGRQNLWATYWEECLRHPIFGFQLERLGYPHNMFLDGLMMFGMFAGWIVTVIIIAGVTNVFKFLRELHVNYWWVLLALADLTQCFTQSGFSSVSLQAPLLLMFILEFSGRATGRVPAPQPPPHPTLLPPFQQQIQSDEDSGANAL